MAISTHGGPKDRVRRPRDKEGLLNQLIEQRTPFSTYRDVMIFSAAVGISHKKKLAFDQTSEPIPWQVMSGTGGETLINLIALVDESNLELLEQDRFEDRLRLFEEYANGGLEIIQQRVATSPGGALDAIRQLVSDQRKQEAAEEPEIPKLSDLAEDLSL